MIIKYENKRVKIDVLAQIFCIYSEIYL